ncbi:MAG: hypothetical protein ABIJ46_04935 [bacterium]
MRIGKYKFSRRQLRKFGWVVISTLAVISMLAFTVAPYFGSSY